MITRKESKEPDYNEYTEEIEEQKKETGELRTTTIC
jgi:hypothetical protein